MLHERSLLEDQKHVLAQIHDLLKKNLHDVLILSGDVYDRSLPSAEAVKLLSWFLTELRRFSEIPVAVIPGNHDSAMRLSYCSELMAFSGVHFQTDPMNVATPLCIDCRGQEANIFMVPYLEPSVYDVHKDGEEIRQGRSHEGAVSEALRMISEKMDNDKINIFAGHLFTRNGITSDSERVFIGTAGDVDPGLFDGFDYTALGHLHKPQQINEKTYYSGSIMKYSFSETSDEKHVLSIDLDKKSVKVEALALDPLRDMKRLKGTFNDLMNSREYNDSRDCYVEVELTDSSIVTNPISILRERFPCILTVRQAMSKSGNPAGA